VERGMRLKDGKDFLFETKHIRGFLKSKIPNLTALKDRIPHSVFVAFDLEFPPQGVSEAGLHFFDPPKRKPTPILPGDGTHRSFHTQNKIQSYSVQVREKIKEKTKREGVKYGSTMYVNEAELSPKLCRLVSSALKPSDSPIIVAFSLFTEFKWISEHCPSLTSLFVGWVDLQDTVAENSGTVDPGLLNTLNAMNIVERPPGSSPPNRHRVSNNAVRCLAVLAGLICLDSLAVPTKIYKPVKLCSPLQTTSSDQEVSLHRSHYYG
jgi:hypothetical protein